MLSSAFDSTWVEVANLRQHVSFSIFFQLLLPLRPVSLFLYVQSFTRSNHVVQNGTDARTAIALCVLHLLLVATFVIKIEPHMQLLII